MHPDEPFDWIDAQTRSMLCIDPPAKQTAIGIKSYTLLLLETGQDARRIEQAIVKIENHVDRTVYEGPSIVARELTLDDAVAGQFELASCDCISAFVPDEVASGHNEDYLEQLAEAVKHSPEFQPVTVRLTSIPNTKAGRRFSWQFLGMAVSMAAPREIQVHRKKARLMLHWGEKSEVQIEQA